MSNDRYVYNEEVEAVRNLAAKCKDWETQRGFITLLDALDDMRERRDRWKDRFVALANAKEEKTRSK